MPATQPTYDLMLMLDTAAPDEQRKKVLSDVQAMVARGGEIVNEQDWGTRATAYEIRHKTDAEYHLLQFHGSRELLETMHRTLHITDGVLRFRVIKLAPGTPDAPEAPAAPPRPTTESAPAESAPSDSGPPAAPEPRRPSQSRPRPPRPPRGLRRRPRRPRHRSRRQRSKRRSRSPSPPR